MLIMCLIRKTIQMAVVPSRISTFGSNCSHVAYRAQLIERLRHMWPRNVRVDQKPLVSLHIGKYADKKVNGETVQFAACACHRILRHVLTGVIDVHLARNAVITDRHRRQAKGGLMKRPARAAA